MVTFCESFYGIVLLNLQENCLFILIAFKTIYSSEQSLFWIDFNVLRIFQVDAHLCFEQFDVVF